MELELAYRPTGKQLAFHASTADEVLYGGAAGGGKSDALVIEALRQVDVPNYRALILRKTFPELRHLLGCADAMPEISADARLFIQADIPGAGNDAGAHDDAHCAEGAGQIRRQRA